MRRLNATKEPLKLVKELDAFPKIEPCYVETNARSGGVSIAMFLLVTALIISEVYYYTSYEVVYEYGVDMEPSATMKIYVDMTIASPCSSIGADLLDITGKHAIDHDNLLEETDTVFELTSQQQAHQEMFKSFNKYLQQRYHSMHENMWDMGYRSDLTQFPSRASDDSTPTDACRLKGTLSSRKLSGNFHITVGKPVQMFGGGHAHLSVFGGTESFNFSHRIHHFSFGEKAPGKLYPLNGDEHISKQGYHVYQYFLKVVPTKINTRYAKVDTYQYSVTEMDRPINHSAGSHGTPGIFFKFDMSPIKVYVEQRYKPFWKFIIRMCGIVGGIFACTGILSGIIETVLDILCCRLQLGKYRPKETAPANTETKSLVSSITPEGSLTSLGNSNTGYSNVTLNLQTHETAN